MRSMQGTEPYVHYYFERKQFLAIQYKDFEPIVSLIHVWLSGKEGRFL